MSYFPDLRYLAESHSSGKKESRGHLEHQGNGDGVSHEQRRAEKNTTSGTACKYLMWFSFLWDEASQYLSKELFVGLINSKYVFMRTLN
jgi:hypothetical protein